MVERQARISAPRYLVTNFGRTSAVYYGTDWNAARSAANRSETFLVHRILFEGWALNLSLIPYREPLIQGTPAPLNDKERGKFENAKDKINRTIRNNKCKEFLESVFGERIVDGITVFLNDQQVFSGPRSTGINVVEAGIYKPDDVDNMSQIALSDDPEESVRFAGLLTQSVADWFMHARRGSRKTGAVVGNYRGNPNTVFYAEYNWLKILHETLHITTGLNDDELASALGVDITKHSGDSQLSSASINKRLKEMGCK